ncbi:MAG: hypothetical protein GY914_04160 [Prochlorococcus sp.]|nr:hypothetical protein [Prochlorococcus sp.]CAI8154733.1 MAG: Uncharacterised protein [Prochlorococcus marinus str. MIT 9215]
MSLSSDAKMQTLLLKDDRKAELKIDSPAGVLRIDLKPDNLRLWQETLERYSEPCNILIACESDQGELHATRVTWVVGSAIRPAQVDGPNQASELLISLGIDGQLAELATEHCPGLGEDFTWAFYLERHGLLTASPVLTSTQANLLQGNNPAE